MLKTSAIFVASLGLSACMQTAIPIQMIENGTPAIAAPLTYFHQGVKGSTNRDASISTATFSFTCDPNFAGGGSLQKRADASAQYSKIAHEKVLFWMVNSMVTRGLLGEINTQSVAAQGCAATNVDLKTVTTDPVTVMRFTLDNRLLGKIMDMR